MTQSKLWRGQTWRERGAIGKALIVYLFSGSLLAAGGAYLLFHAIGH